MSSLFIFFLSAVYYEKPMGCKKCQHFGVAACIVIDSRKRKQQICVLSAVDYKVGSCVNVFTEVIISTQKLGVQLISTLAIIIKQENCSNLKTVIITLWFTNVNNTHISCLFRGTEGCLVPHKEISTTIWVLFYSLGKWLKWVPL